MIGQTTVPDKETAIAARPADTGTKASAVMHEYEEVFAGMDAGQLERQEWTYGVRDTPPKCVVV